MAWGLFYSVIGIFYYVSMHALFGQTIGKMVTRIKVMDVSEKRYLRVHQACLREILPILLIPLSLLMHYQFAFLGMTKESISQQAWAIYFGYSIFFWVLLEMISMLFNGKRRAVHDFIAGSVVVKTNLTMHSTGLASLAR